MKSVDSRSDRELLAHAHRLGLLSSNCDTCSASGMRGPRVDPRNPHGAAVDMTCDDCSGSGRWWFPAIRPLGRFTAHLTDAQLRVWIATGTRRGAVDGN